MKTKLAVLLALLALVPFAVAACGDDDEEPADEAATTEETTDTDGAAAGGEVVEFTADPTGELAYEQDSAEATSGMVTISLTNEASVPHDVRIEGPEGDDLGGTEEISGGDTAEADVELEPGEYTFYCSVPGHREAGMEGPLTVE